MRQSVAKTLRQKASFFTRQNPENFRTIYQQTKKLWLNTPRTERNKLFI